MVNEKHLNLARKWRSKTFDQIIGQDLSIKMLKNSLFRGYYFPVYLFSGQRGCGKTTTARVFSAAINCEQLIAFQDNPRDIFIPCEQCSSCHAMKQATHPDFFEIDAASHTGVDMMREIIDAASLLPIMGKKKIYLIDEAHMLSKAAFNALLKILEEPPKSVLFILATTDPEKIIDTVRSRCFQLFFTPIAAKTLVSYLREICTHESIAYEVAGLEAIVHETEGSARDALNLLEQIRFSYPQVSKSAVHEVLGHLGDEHIIDLLRAILLRQADQVVRICSTVVLANYSAEFILRRLFELVRACLFYKHGACAKDGFVFHAQAVQNLTGETSMRRLCEISEKLYQAEQILAKTTAKHLYLEMLFLRLCQSGSDDDSSNNSDSSVQSRVAESSVWAAHESGEEQEDIDQAGDQAVGQDRWEQFINKLSSLHVPILISIFSQAKEVTFDESTQVLTAQFNQAFSFYEDTLNQERLAWFPLLQSCYSSQVSLQWLFTYQELPKESKAIQKKVTEKSQQTANARPLLTKKIDVKYTNKTESRVSDADFKKLARAPVILQHFPGSLYKVGEIHETV